MARQLPPEPVGRGPGKAAFTLVEVLLAITLMSIIMTVMYGAFHTMGRIIRRNERTKGAYQTARLVMSRIREDLNCAYFSPVRKNFIFRGENIRGYDAETDAVTFVTAGHVISGRDAPEGDFAEVSYYLDENYPGILVRREDVSPDTDTETGGVLEILGKNVVGLNFTYLDGTEESSRRRDQTITEEESEREKKAWKEEWDSDEKPYLPRAVMIDLAVLNDFGLVEDFSTTVMVAMGRTPTSGQPGQPQAAPQTGVPTRPTGPRGGPRGPEMRPGERPPEGRGDFQRGPGPQGDRGGREGSRPPTPGTGDTSGQRPTIRRGAYYGGSGVRPPTPGGR